MLTDPKLRSQVDFLWDKFWTGGLANPLDAIEQFSYLLFLKQLEDRSNSTDDIACWFIDTDYNEETFIVRHAYFTGADQPYEKLQRALRAEIDESAWSALYSTTSYPFEKPKTGKIAVKVINHYGDEVLKVYDVK